MIDYSFAPEHLRKPRPKALQKADKDKAIAAKDKAESAKARKRAGGRCEVREQTQWGCFGRCQRKDSHTHHLLSGIGRRNRGLSILAAWKLRVCNLCHADIHAKVLQPIAADMDSASIRYRRVR